MGSHRTGQITRFDIEVTKDKDQTNSPFRVWEARSKEDSIAATSREYKKVFFRPESPVF